MVWCPVDRCYYCGRCYTDTCKPAHGEKPALRMQYRMLEIALLVVSGSALVPLAGALILTPTEPGSLVNNETIGFVLLLPVIAGAVWFSVSTGVRRILHSRAVSGHPPMSPDVLRETRDSSLPWRPNRAAFPRRLAILATVVGATAVVDLVLVLFVAPVSPPGARVGIEAAVVVATMLGGTAALLAALPFSVPSAVAIAGDGVHFWYDSPYDRRTLRGVMPWVDLNILERSTPGQVDPIKRLVRFLRIDRENAEAIADEWPKHRIDRSVPARTTTSAPGTAPHPAPVRTSPRPQFPPVGGTVNASQRGAACARCHVRFPGLEGLRLLWCKVDRFNVCRRCWREECREGHGRGMKAISKPVRLVSGVVIAIAFLAVWYPAVAYDYSLKNAWENYPPVAISSLRVGELAKVDGTLSSPRLVAWGGHEEYSSRDGWYWVWNSTDAFDLSDGSGTIPVTTRAWYIGYNGPHPAPYAMHTEMWIYESGDAVQVVGTVARLANGTVSLEAQIIAQLPYVQDITLSPSPEDSVLTYLMPPLMVALVVGGAAVLLWQRARTRAALRGQPILSLGSTGEVRDPNLHWLPNGRGTDPRRRGIWAGAILLVGVGGLVIYSGLGPRAGSGYSMMGFPGTIVVMLEGFAVYTLLFAGFGRPAFVAVADDGFHLWFESPYDRHLNETLFPWAEIQDIHMTGGKTSHWVLRWTTGELTNLYMMKGSNLNLLLTEWAKRRMAAT